MFKSVLPWVSIPCTIKVFDKRTGTGSKLFIAETPDTCYPEERMELIKNSMGKEIISNTRLYMKGSSVIKELDEVSYDDSRFFEVIAVSAYYRNNAKDILVVYL